jgi:hypothetical protein
MNYLNELVINLIIMNSDTDKILVAIATSNKLEFILITS